MKLDRYAKAIAAAAVAGGTAFNAAGGSTLHELAIGLVAAAVTGIVTWGVPNDVSTELLAVASTVEHTSVADTQVFPTVPAAGA